MFSKINKYLKKYLIVGLQLSPKSDGQARPFIPRYLLNQDSSMPKDTKDTSGGDNGIFVTITASSSLS